MGLSPQLSSKERVYAFGKLVGLILVWWLFTTAIYWKAPCNFLRAESGYYLNISHDSSAVQHTFLREVATKNYNGHYTPLADAAEFSFAKIAGTKSKPWKNRQLLLVTLLAVTTFLVAVTSTRSLGLSRLTSAVVATAVAALFVFQPNMTDFVTWPFMAMQLLWGIATFAALLALIQMLRRPAEMRWVWLAVCAAYISLHGLGLGLATVAATTLVLWMSLPLHPPRSQRTVWIGLAVLLTVSGAHAIAMVALPGGAPAGNVTPWRPGEFLPVALGFFWDEALAAAGALVSLNRPNTSAALLADDWAYGGAFLFICLITLFFLLRYGRATRKTETAVLASLNVYGLTLFLAILAMMLYREISNPSGLAGFSGYLVGPRYLIPVNFAFLGCVTWGLSVILQRSRQAGVVIASVLCLAVVFANLRYEQIVYPRVRPASKIDHEATWKAIA